jgi:hypothetical protein
MEFSLNGNPYRLFAKDGMLAFAYEDDDDGPGNRTVARDGYAYVIMFYFETVLVAPEEALEGDPEIFLGSVEKLKYVSSGTSAFAGDLYDYDAFDSPDGSVMQYFVDGGALIGIRATFDGGFYRDFIVDVLDHDVPDDIFDIPEDFEWLDYTDLED